MPVTRLNHVVLYVRDVERTKAFYQEVFGFRLLFGVPDRAAFLQAPGSTNDHDLGIFGIGEAAGASEAGRRTVGMYHIAWEVTTLNELASIREELVRRGNLVGQSNHGTTKSLYGVDPDGLEFEVCWLIPRHLLSEGALEERLSTTALHLEREIERYGGDTVGGLGVSVPLGVTVDG